MHARMYVRMYVCTIYVYVSMYVYMYVCMYVRMTARNNSAPTGRIYMNSEKFSKNCRASSYFIKI